MPLSPFCVPDGAKNGGGAKNDELRAIWRVPELPIVAVVGGRRCRPGAFWSMGAAEPLEGVIGALVRLQVVTVGVCGRMRFQVKEFSSLFGVISLPENSMRHVTHGA